MTKRKAKMNVVEIPFSQAKLLPCAADVCQECAVKHEPELPHNNQSLYYQYKFYQREGRWPTWKDAMLHCSEEMKQFWIQNLLGKGVKVEEV